MERVTLFYDADCGFCQGSVEWLLGQARAGTFDPVAYQDDEGMRKFPMVDLTLADKGIQVLQADGKVWAKSKAVGFCLTLVPKWKWVGHFILFPLVAPFAAVGYAVVAANRQRISKLIGKKSCRIPPRARE